MNRMQRQVMEWHEKFGVPVAAKPSFPSAFRQVLREKLISEEALEFKNAETLIQIADALGDLLYVTFGAALEYGIDMEPIFDEIQRSNMSKLGIDGKPIIREDGKILKGPDFFEPNIDLVLKQQIWPAKFIL